MQPGGGVVLRLNWLRMLLLLLLLCCCCVVVVVVVVVVVLLLLLLLLLPWVVSVDAVYRRTLGLRFPKLFDVFWHIHLAIMAHHCGRYSDIFSCDFYHESVTIWW